MADLIAKRRMMFVSPNTFNDPYDCNPKFIRGSDPVKDRKYILAAWNEGRKRRGIPAPSRAQRDRHVSNVMAKLSTPAGANASFRPFINSGTGVFCMSRSWRLLTQWAYYGGSGSGLCLEYNVKPNEGFDRVYSVSYSKLRPVVEITRLLSGEPYQTQALLNAVLTKANSWKHEKEVRALSTKPGILEHPIGMLTRIFVGHRVSDDDLKWLQDLVSGACIAATIVRTELCPETYQLKHISP